MTFPGERYDILVDAYSEDELKTEFNGTRQFWMRATTFRSSHWSYSDNINAYEFAWSDDVNSKYQVLGVLNYYEEFKWDSDATLVDHAGVACTNDKDGECGVGGICCPYKPSIADYQSVVHHRACRHGGIAWNSGYVGLYRDDIPTGDWINGVAPAQQWDCSSPSADCVGVKVHEPADRGFRACNAKCDNDYRSPPGDSELSCQGFNYIPPPAAGGGAHTCWLVYKTKGGTDIKRIDTDESGAIGYWRPQKDSDASKERYCIARPKNTTVSQTREQWNWDDLESRHSAAAAPSMTRVVDVSKYIEYNDSFYQGYKLEPENIFDDLNYFRWTDNRPDHCTIPSIPANDGKGNETKYIESHGYLGAPFGCYEDGPKKGQPKSLPEPDLIMAVWVNGIMYPKYELFLGTSDVMEYDAKKWKDPEHFSEETWSKLYASVTKPNMWERPKLPLTLTRGFDGNDEQQTKLNRNESVWAPSMDLKSNPSLDPNNPYPEPGLSKIFKEKLIEYKANKTHYGVTGVTNETRPVYFNESKWVRIIVQNAGPMVHPFHIHGYSTYYLGSYRQFADAKDVAAGLTVAGTPIRHWDHPCTSNCSAGLKKRDRHGCDARGETRKPMMLTPFNSDERCAKTAAPYMNMYGSELIPPVHQRTAPLHGVYGPEHDRSGDSDFDEEFPAMRDMVLAPPHSWSVFQFYTDNPGAWFFHCHLELHAGFGMAIALMVGAEKANTPNQSWLNAGATPAQIFENNQHMLIVEGDRCD